MKQKLDGNLIYYEDLPTAFYNWHRVLKTGGCLFLHESHPLTSCLEEDKTSGNLSIRRTYGDRIPEYALFRISDFVSEDLEEVEFHHAMADILNALIQAGFIKEKMIECQAAQAGFAMEGLAELPHDFYVIARKVE